MKNEGGCIVTETSELLETWASAYKRIMTDVPSHSGLYKPSVCTHVSLTYYPLQVCIVACRKHEIPEV